VAAVASRDADRAQVFAAQNAIPHWFGDYEAMLASTSIDAVFHAHAHAHTDILYCPRS
jgi:predicted dehydrogenase